ncbi:relaxase/mobilization nuclease domain-containing protein [Mucilaginibacter terrae]|uniref:MobA/VirD2-like nuclease domain-containing protein n=1 Tax=Mucilaginibacter terrae TaxID=1955052 RepID=A0ABU3GMP4_9SPHI|nr:relaxase/mobilization nuclease domain-containing protein [Mucilaginibacter terrae]MDT3401055.1 hypothetical protein [Mucilaginibacter terrae]
MVAKIKTGRSILGAINYNEHKVRLDKAELIMAQGYLKEPTALSFSEKLNRLTDLADRNERTAVNTLHVSLNFAVGENLDRITLQKIADDYIQGLGFGGQPFLVYQHHDAGHPHLHIVTTNIKANGERISFHLLANKASEQSRKQIEQTYNLVKAEDQTNAHKLPIPVSLEKVIYGKSETKRSISNMLNEVLRTYKFTSLPELNAVLNRLNVTADRGSKDSRMYAKNGLVYWVTNERGNKLGVPIKASSIYGKPTLKTLEDRFRLNEVLRKPMKDQLVRAIDVALLNPTSKAKFAKDLNAQNIQVVFRQNEEGRIYGLTFVDHRSKAVFNGSDLGKAYSATMLTARFLNADSILHDHNEAHGHHDAKSSLVSNSILSEDQMSSNDSNVLDILFSEEHQDLSAIGKLQQRKRRKKRKGHSL